MKANTCPSGHILGEGDNKPVLAANGGFICDFCAECLFETGRAWYNVGQHEQYHYQHSGQILHDIGDLLTASIGELDRLGGVLCNLTEAQARDWRERVGWIAENFRIAREELE